jgi:hypothetical protein
MGTSIEREAMTLEQVRDWHLSHTKYVHLPITNACHQEFADAIDAAIKQREQDAKDAARYRWLRNESGRNGKPYIRCDDPPFEPLHYWITAVTADRCIDRAMAKESGNG